MKKINMVLGGGMGNQMFQYAAARSYQLQYGGNLKLSTYFYKEKKNKDRNYSLVNLKLNKDIEITSNEEDVCIQQKIEKYNKKLRYERFFPQKVKKIIMKYGEREGIVKSLFSTYKYVPFCGSKSNNIVMYGGFQSLHYFEKIQNIIKEEFQIQSEITKNNQIIADQIKKEESVCVHVRRGDFLNNEFSHLNVCNQKYYENAMNTILKKKDDAVFFVFSNTHEDIEWIKENIKFPANTIYVDENNKDYQELQLMSLCKHFIISNSTFSWWAQFLATNEDKLVCAPSRWDLSYPEEAKDIYMDNWIVI